MRHFALRSPTECGGGSPPLGVEKSGVGELPHAHIIQRGLTLSQAVISMSDRNNMNRHRSNSLRHFCTAGTRQHMSLRHVRRQGRERGEGRKVSRAEIADATGSQERGGIRRAERAVACARSKRAKKRHGDRALVCFPICCCASAMSFCASVAVYTSCASAGGVKPLPLTSRALVMKVKAMGSHSWMMRLTVLICLRLTTHTSTLCSSPV